MGTEILLGNITNSNAVFLSEKLAAIGVSVFKHTSVGDNFNRLKNALEHAFENADMVITTGGLGPTADDITKTVAAKFFGLKLIQHEESMQRIVQRFSGVGELPKNVERNAFVPEGAKVFINENGAAPGICIEKDGKILIMLPGPPNEMQPMFLNYVLKFLKEKTENVFVSRTLKIIGVGETAVESELRDLIDAQTNPTIAPYAKVGEVHIRITASATNENAANELLKPIADEIYSRLGKKIYAENETTLAQVLIKALNGKTLAIAESCTGGLIASEIVSVAGSSSVFREGFVTYSNEAKTARLSVPEKTIESFGAVSQEVAAAMAEGAAKAADTDFALSITGIAGPDGGTREKPVGLVYTGVFIKEKGTFTKKFNFLGNRNDIRRRSAINAMDFLRSLIYGE